MLACRMGVLGLTEQMLLLQTCREHYDTWRGHLHNCLAVAGSSGNGGAWEDESGSATLVR